jgi:lysophospholipase L1-like esterase
MLWIAYAGGLLALWVVAEFAARSWLRLRKRYYVWLPGLRRELRTDRSAVPEYEPVIRIEVNSDGERGAEAPGTTHGLYRVLAAGGSAVEGYALDQPSNWPAVLERILSTPGGLDCLGATRVHVGTIARSAVTCQDLDLVFERVLPQYRRLDAIVVMIGAGDVVRWLADGAPADAPPPAPASDVFACHPEGPFGWRPSRSAIWELTKRARWLLFRPVDVRDHVGRWIVQARAMRAAAAEIRTSVADPTALLDNFESYFGRVLQRAQARAKRVIAVRQPWFEKDYTPEEVAHFWHGGAGHAWAKQTVSTYYALDVVNRLMALLDARALKVAEQLGVEQLELQTLLEPSLDTYYDYTHFTPAGARTVAEAVAAVLLRQRASQASRPEHRFLESTPAP